MPDLDNAKIRKYPSCCTSAYCGRIDCVGCPNEPVLSEFNDWVSRTGARCVDPIWSPLFYEVPTCLKTSGGQANGLASTEVTHGFNEANE